MTLSDYQVSDMDFIIISTSRYHPKKLSCIILSHKTEFIIVKFNSAFLSEKGKLTVYKFSDAVIYLINALYLYHFLFLI